jgi:hypothetical protein
MNRSDMTLEIALDKMIDKFAQIAEQDDIGYMDKINFDRADALCWYMRHDCANCPVHVDGYECCPERDEFENTVYGEHEKAQAAAKAFVAKLKKIREGL